MKFRMFISHTDLVNLSSTDRRFTGVFPSAVLSYVTFWLQADFFMIIIHFLTVHWKATSFAATSLAATSIAHIVHFISLWSYNCVAA